MFDGPTRGWIGIDLGTSAVKLAQVRRVGARWRLVHARIVRRAPGNGRANLPEEILAWWEDTCQDRQNRAGFVGRRAACVLPASVTDLRAVHLPDGSEPERRAMIAGELESIFSAGAARRTFDFWECRPPAGEEESKLENVNVLSVAEDEAALVAEALGRAGLRCLAIDGLPLALAGAVGMVQPAEAQAPVAAVDWGHASATFSVICAGRPVFTRHFRDCGFGALVSATSEGLGLPADDAEPLLGMHGLPDPASRGGDHPDAIREIQEVLADVTSQALGSMVSQLNKSLAYPELHRSRLVPRKIWLFGGGATVRNMAAVLSARVGLPFEAWRLPGAEGPGSLGAVPDALLGPAVALSALGLAPDRIPSLV